MTAARQLLEARNWLFLLADASQADLTSAAELCHLPQAAKLLLACHEGLPVPFANANAVCIAIKPGNYCQQDVAMYLHWFAGTSDLTELPEPQVALQLLKH